MSYRLHTNADLRASLSAQFPCYFIEGPGIMNERYCSVTHDWVDNTFGPYYGRYLAARGMTDWKRRGNQCEHYAIRAALEAVDMFRQSADPEIPAEAESIAVMWNKYVKMDGTGVHDINHWFIGGTWLPWEPQTQRFVTLTPDEIQTVQQITIP